MKLNPSSRLHRSNPEPQKPRNNKMEQSCLTLLIVDHGDIS